MTNHPEQLTDRELQDVTSVFKSFETGLREATIDQKDLHKAMRRLGLNPTEQEAAILSGETACEGLIYFSDFCQLVLGHFRKDCVEDELFRQNMFKVTRLIVLFETIVLQMMCGTDPYPTRTRPKKYKLDKHALSKKDFVHIMKNLPVPVENAEIEEMFTSADKNGDGWLSYSEFKVMVNPPAPPVLKPHISDMKKTAI
jgi:Ca2+-binding EF-hand superfamily protein